MYKKFCEHDTTAAILPSFLLMVLSIKLKVGASVAQRLRQKSYDRRDIKSFFDAIEEGFSEVCLEFTSEQVLRLIREYKF